MNVYKLIHSSGSAAIAIGTYVTGFALFELGKIAGTLIVTKVLWPHGFTAKGYPMNNSRTFRPYSFAGIVTRNHANVGALIRLYNENRLALDKFPSSPVVLHKQETISEWIPYAPFNEARGNTDITLPGTSAAAAARTLALGQSYPVGTGSLVVQTYKTFTGSKQLPAGNGGVLLIINYNVKNPKNYQWIQVVTVDTMPNKSPNKIIPYVDQSGDAIGDYYYNKGSVDYIYKANQAIFQDRPYSIGPGQLMFNLRLVDATNNNVTLFQFQWGFTYNKDGTITAAPLSGCASGGGK